MEDADESTEMQMNPLSYGVTTTNLQDATKRLTSSWRFDPSPERDIKIGKSLYIFLLYLRTSLLIVKQWS